jgi:hypothetical protein
LLTVTALLPGPTSLYRLFTNLDLMPWWLRLDQPEPEPFVQQQPTDSEAEEPAVTLFQAR